MFGRRRGDAPGVSEKDVFEHVMATLYRLGEPGALITPGYTSAARDLAKSEACDSLRARGGTAKQVRATEAAYDHVGNRIAAMFGASGPYAGSTFSDAGSDAAGTGGAGQSGSAGEDPDGPCAAGDNKIGHVPTRVGDGPTTCYYCGVRLRDA